MNAIVPMTTAAGLPSRLPDDVIEAYLVYRGQRRDVVLYGTSRAPHEVWPRHELAFLLSRLTRLSNAQIGLLFGGRDHATVNNSIGRVSLRIEHDRVYARDVKALEQFALEWVPGNAEAVCQIAARALRGMASAAEVSALAVTIMSVSSVLRAPDLSPAEAVATAVQMLRHAPGVGHV